MNYPMPARMLFAHALVALAPIAGLEEKIGLHAAEAPPVCVSIVYFASAATTPESDSPPRVLEAVPIELAPKVAAAVKPGTGGRFTIRVTTEGSVRDLTFADDASPGRLTQPIRQTLARWKFEPIRSGGKVVPANVQLAYWVQPLPTAKNAISGNAQPPKTIFRVEPTPPPALTRRGLGRQDLDSFQKAPDRSQRQVVRVIDPKTGVSKTVETLVRIPGNWLTETFIQESYSAWMNATVAVEYDVAESGMAENLTVVESSCHLLEPEAAAALGSWRFTPAHMDGKPMRSRLRETFSFRTPKDVSIPKFIRPLVPNKPGWDAQPTFANLALPVYPTELAHAKMKGTARAEVRIDASGEAQEINILEATHPEFGQALRAAMFASRWVPAQRGGQSVAAAFIIEARFTDRPQDMTPGDEQMPAVLLQHRGEAPVKSAVLDSKPRLLIGRQPNFRIGNPAPGEPGTVVLEITIDATGRVRDPTVVPTSDPWFGYVAVQASASWLFEAPQVQGKPVAARVRVPFKIVPSPP